MNGRATGEQLDDPLAIRECKRFAADRFDLGSLAPPQVQKTGKKAAVIGAGPAGLACAHDLALAGHDVTVFEASAEPGGMLRYAIPEYRLPRSEVEKEIDYIRSLGVEIRCNAAIGKEMTLPALMRGYDAVFIGTGAPAGMPLGIEGEDLPGVTDGIRFLRQAAEASAVAIGPAVAVVGGGNTAVDCARTARRLGSAEVTVVYRRTRDEMPAAQEEVEALLQEGIKLQFLAAPVRFHGKDGKLSEMECVRMELGEPDASNRRRPAPVRGSEFRLPVATVITALGQAVETSFVEGLGVALANNRTISIDPATGATGIEGIFAGGDVVTGPAYVIDAIAAGKKAAASMNRYLKGEPVVAQGPPKAPEKLSDAERAGLIGCIPRTGRIRMPEEPPEARVADFRDVSPGYSPDAAQIEASRCLAGRIEGCIECGECERRCDVGAVDYRMEDETVEARFDSIVLAPGFDLYDPTEKREYGYGTLPGVMTGIEFERICSVTGPTGGDLIVNGKTPRRFFFIQCVGSRDRQSNARFCSRVCCMYTAKHASIVKDRVKDAEVYVSYIDVRAYGKNYEEFYKSTQEAGAFYIRGIPGEVTKGKDGLVVRVEDMLSGELREIEVDVVVLATGVRPRKETAELCDIMSVDRDEYGFIRTSAAAASKTNVEGIFVAGMASGPKDVPDTVASGGEAASRCLEYIFDPSDRPDPTDPTDPSDRTDPSDQTQKKNQLGLSK